MSDKEVEQQGVEESKENVADEPKETKIEVVEKEQEAKLRAKYPGLKGPGSNMFLQKRLAKGQKYFDSGDYNMAKAKMGGAASKPIPPTQKLLLRGSTGEEIPTPEAIPHKKSSMIQSKLASEGLS